MPLSFLLFQCHPFYRSSRFCYIAVWDFFTQNPVCSMSSLRSRAGWLTRFLCVATAEIFYVANINRGRLWTNLSPSQEWPGRKDCAPHFRTQRLKDCKSNNQEMLFTIKSEPCYSKYINYSSLETHEWMQWLTFFEMCLVSVSLIRSAHTPGTSSCGDRFCKRNV